jgi:hypothetical protein
MKSVNRVPVSLIYQRLCGITKPCGGTFGMEKNSNICGAVSGLLKQVIPSCVCGEHGVDQGNEERSSCKALSSAREYKKLE